MEAFLQSLRHVRITRSRLLTASLERCACAWEDAATDLHGMAAQLTRGAEGLGGARTPAERAASAREARLRVPRLELGEVTAAAAKDAGGDGSKGQAVGSMVAAAYALSSEDDGSSVDDGSPLA